MAPERALTAEFHHAPLEKHEIRLLEIKPGFEYDEVRCNLLEVPFDQAPPYAAISYRWGTTTDRMSIRIGRRSLEVMPNAYWAIHYQRQIGKWRYIWIDCICINQADTGERNHQVAVMSRIYSRASEVFVWLGLPDPLIDAAFEELRRAFQLDPDSKSENDHLAALSRLEPLLSVDYWTRTWIIQEVSFASTLTVMSGEQRLSWEHLATTILFYTGLTSSAGRPKSWTAVCSLVDHRRKMQCQAPDFLDQSFKRLRDQVGTTWYSGIEKLLESFSQSECSDPRDKVFALLEMWKRQAPEPFEADYTMSLSDVLLTTYAYIVKHSVNPEYPFFCRLLQATLECTILVPASCYDNPPDLSSIASPVYKVLLSGSKVIDVPALKIPYRLVFNIIAVRKLEAQKNSLAEILAWIEGCAPFFMKNFTELGHKPYELENFVRRYLLMVEKRWITDDCYIGTPCLFVDVLGRFGLAFPAPQIGDWICPTQSGNILLVRSKQVVGAAFMLPDLSKGLTLRDAFPMGASTYPEPHVALCDPYRAFSLSPVFASFLTSDTQ